MTYDELREAVARAMNEAALKARTENPDIPDEEYDAVQADAALAVVREALREPTGAMIHQGGSSSDHPSVFMGGPGHE